MRARVLVGVVAALVAAWLILIVLPPWLAVTEPKAAPADNLKAVSDARAALVQLVAGAALFVGLLFTAKTYRLTQRGQLTDRFSDAVAQLADDHAVVRMGGIFALEQVSRDWAAYGQTVSDVLGAFVRGRATTGGVVEASVQAALTVLGRRDRSAAPRMLDLSGCKLESADFQQTNFDHTDFTAASLAKGQFVDASMVRAEFAKADLTDAKLSAADLRGANLREAILVGTDFYGAKLKNARLRTQDVSRARNLTPQQLAEAEVIP